MMSDMKPEGQPATDAATGSDAAQSQASAAAAASAEEALNPAIVIDKLRAENADLRDRLLRAHAEMDNIRKRTDREKSEAHKYAVTRFARDIVTVGDNFQRAIEAVPADAIEQDPTLKSFLEGVTMTERELINTLERHGIKRIDPKGQPFNPHMHQAVMEQPDPSVPTGTVTQVFQLGYMIEERVLRPAMVVVARGGFKPKPVETGEPPQAANDQAGPPGAAQG